MAITIRNVGSQVGSVEEITKALKDILTDLEDQLNQRAVVYSDDKGRTPSGLKQNDILISTFKGRMTVKVRTSSSYVSLNADMLDGLTKNGTYYRGHKTAAIAPTVATDFPNNDDWGFYTHTGTAHYLCLNVGGALKKVALT